MPRRRRASQFASRKMRKVRADRKMIDALQIELIASEREVVVAEKSNERFEVIAIRRDGIDGDVPLVSEVVEKLADFVRHARAPEVNDTRALQKLIVNWLIYPMYVRTAFSRMSRPMRQ